MPLVTPDGRSGPSQALSAKTLVRSLGSVVPSCVEVFQALLPTFFISMYEGIVWPVAMVSAVVASGKLWLMYCAA